MKGIFCWTYQCSFHVIGGVQVTSIGKQAGIAMLCNLVMYLFRGVGFVKARVLVLVT